MGYFEVVSAGRNVVLKIILTLFSSSSTIKNYLIMVSGNQIISSVKIYYKSLFIQVITCKEIGIVEICGF